VFLDHKKLKIKLVLLTKVECFHPETRAKMAAAKIGRKFLKKLKLKWVKQHKGNSNNTERKQSIEEIERRRVANTGKSVLLNLARHYHLDLRVELFLDETKNVWGNQR